jgi:hypothetical protein
MDHFALTFKLTDGLGWAHACVSVGAVTHETAVSYLTQDPLGEFAQALIEYVFLQDATTIFIINRNVTDVDVDELRQRTFRWEDEPGGWRWTLKPHDGIAVRVRLEQLHTRSGEQPLIESICLIREIASALVDCIEGLLLTHGIAGYRAKWQLGDLPLSQYLMLKRWLQSPHPMNVENGTWHEDLAILRSLGVQQAGPSGG